MDLNAPIIYYITAHGYGHGTRACDILNALCRQAPRIPIIVVSDLPKPFLSHRLNADQVTFRKESFDVGLVQFDDIQVDVPATLNKVIGLHEKRDQLIQEETAFLNEQQAALVIVDIPAIPLFAAKEVGIPSIAIANFGWDWIYSAFTHDNPRWKKYVDWFHEGYATTDLLLRLPFSEEMNAFPRIEDIFLVASPGRERRGDIIKKRGCVPTKKWILLSFGALNWDPSVIDRIQKLEPYEFFTVYHLFWEGKNFHAIDMKSIPFSDLIASMDGVISKPGYGIVSDCIANKKPLACTDRSNFLECSILVEGIKKYLQHVYLPAEKLYKGDIAETIEKLLNVPLPQHTMGNDGVKVAIHRIMDLYDDESSL
ncbi:MAG: hypothetical protein GKR87_12185 [Kiritimatiellae bacterium]|nr:hypothetical protein [Kiritimatiellia bacterium]